MAGGGYTGVGTFRKTYQKNAKPPKYQTFVKTTEELEKENNDQDADIAEEDDNEVQVAVSTNNKDYSIEDIMKMES